MSITTGHKIAIQWMPTDNYDDVVKLIKDFNSYGFGDDIVLFSNAKTAFNDNDVKDLRYEYIECPDSCDNNSKIKNFIIQYAKDTLGSFRFLHIIEGNAKLLKDPTTYINEIEHVMDILDYNIHFSTITDQCNYLFKKFCPRLTIDIDDVDVRAKTGLPQSISFTSHSNIVWTIYDYEKCGDVGPQKYDERFSIAMFMIIEYLARRRNTKRDGQLYYMNQYLSIPSEIGVFTTIDNGSGNIDPKKMQEEDTIFKAMNIDYSPDNNIDKILEEFYALLKK